MDFGGAKAMQLMTACANSGYSPKTALDGSAGRLSQVSLDPLMAAQQTG